MCDSTKQKAVRDTRARNKWCKRGTRGRFIRKERRKKVDAKNPIAMPDNGIPFGIRKLSMKLRKRGGSPPSSTPMKETRATRQNSTAARKLPVIIEDKRLTRTRFKSTRVIEMVDRPTTSAGIDRANLPSTSKSTITAIERVHVPHDWWWKPGLVSSSSDYDDRNESEWQKLAAIQQTARENDDKEHDHADPEHRADSREKELPSVGPTNAERTTVEDPVATESTDKLSTGEQPAQTTCPTMSQRMRDVIAELRQQRVALEKRVTGPATTQVRRPASVPPRCDKQGAKGHSVD